MIYDLFSFARCPVAMASIFLISSSDVNISFRLEKYIESSRSCSVFLYSYLMCSVFPFLVVTVSLLVSIHIAMSSLCVGKYLRNLINFHFP